MFRPAELRRGPTRFGPLILIFVIWCSCCTLITALGRWGVFADCWPLTLTMCAGSFVAGATSEGGGAVAFPVMTLVFGISPPIARDFSLLIQSVGMTSAAALILLRRIPVEFQAVKWATIGGACGMIFGLEVVAPLLPAAYTKIFFTSLWLSFGVALYLLNTTKDRTVHSMIGPCGGRNRALLILLGFLGGLISSITGSGIDILVFTMLTLYFRISEKVATPTSVILMAVNAVIGSLWSGLIHPTIDDAAWAYWYACLPVVVIGAPLGAFFISSRSRRFIAYLLYTSIAAQFIAAIILVPQTPALFAFGAVTVIAGLSLFAAMTKMSPHKVSADGTGDAPAAIILSR